MRDKLRTKPCMNQGFVLDGFPKTYEQAKQLFTGEKFAFFRWYINKLNHDSD